MAPNKKNNGVGDKNKDKKGKKTPRPNGINYSGKYDFRGRLIDGRAYCIPCMQAGNHRGMANNETAISSHLSKKHGDGAYRRDQSRLTGKQWECRCGHKRPSWNPFLAHIRSAHEFKGSSAAVRASGYFDCSTDPVSVGGNDEHEHEDKDEDEDDEMDYGSPQQSTPRNFEDQHDGDDDDGAGAAGIAA